MRRHAFTVAVLSLLMACAGMLASAATRIKTVLDRTSHLLGRKANRTKPNTDGFFAFLLTLALMLTAAARTRFAVVVNTFTSYGRNIAGAFVGLLLSLGAQAATAFGSMACTINGAGDPEDEGEEGDGDEPHLGDPVYHAFA